MEDTVPLIRDQQNVLISDNYGSRNNNNVGKLNVTNGTADYDFENQ
jgi:hypothetical protein